MMRFVYFLLALYLGIIYIAAKSIDADIEEELSDVKDEVQETLTPQCGLSRTMAWAECDPCPSTCSTADDCMFPYCDSNRMCKCQKVWCKDDMMCRFFRISCAGNFTCRDNSCICDV